MRFLSVYRVSSFVLLFFVLTNTFGQTSTANQQKINVYKTAINGNAVKDGIKGISVVFSAEYNFGDQVYASMRNSEGKNQFDYYLSLTDKNGQPVYSAADFKNYKKANKTIANHWAEEVVVEPANKVSGRRSTGVELFVPYMDLDLPAGSQTVKLAINASNEKGGKFRNLYTQDLTINKPAVYFVTLEPKQIAVLDKAGKKYEAEALEQDLYVLPGTNKEAKDIMASVNADTKQVLPFKYSAGDVLRIKLDKSTSTGTIGTNKVRTLRGTNGQNLTSFDNKAALTGEWPLDINSSKTVNVKNNALNMVLAVEKVTVPPVKLSGFAVNPYAAHNGATGASITFAYDAKSPVEAPVLVAVPFYATDGGSEKVMLKGGKVTSGKAKVDSTGNIILGGSGKIEVFYPTFNVILNDPNIRQQVPQDFALQIRLKNHKSPITLQEVKQNFPIPVIQDAKIPPAVLAQDTTFENTKGFFIGIPYEMPPLYFELLKGNVLVQISEPSAKDVRGTDILRNMKLMSSDVKTVADPANKKGVTFQLSKPAGVIPLFMPYTDLGRQEKAPLPFASKVLATDGASKQVEVGNNPSAIRFNIDNKRIKFITVGISPIKMKKANTGNFVWRVSSADRVLYQSPVIPADKTIENLYSHSFYIHETDKVIVEVLRGNDASNLKPMMKWEKPVSALTSSENLDLIPAAVLPGMDDRDTKSATLSYTVQ